MKNKRKEEMKQQNKKLYKKQQSGRSMVEMVGVLAIMGLVTAAAFVLITSGMSSQKINRVADEVDVLVSNARSMTAESEYTCSLPLNTEEGLEKGKSLAKAILKTESTPLGGQYAITHSTTGKTCDKDTKFVIHITKMDSDACETLAARAWNNGTGSCDGGHLSITFNK